MSALARLGEEIARRRRSLGLTIAGAAQEAGINRATWSTAENGERVPQVHNRAGIERALRWAPGSIDAILSGKPAAELAPAETPAAPDGRPLTPLEEEIERLRNKRGLSPRDKIAALRALVDFYAQQDIDEGREERPTA